MTKNPKVSVVITAYNHGKYIGEAIQSVLVQTLGDFEVIIVDDGSTDNTREVVSSFRDNRIKYHYQANTGLPACSRNKGMGFSSGEYISLLDGDDFWYKEKLAKTAQLLDAMPEIGLVCHNEAVIHDGKMLGAIKRYGPYKDNMYKQLLFGGNCLHSSAVTLRRKIFFEDDFKFSEDRRLFTVEDYEYWMRLSKRYRFYFMPDVLGCYRVTDTGASLSSGKASPVNMLYLLDEHFKDVGYEDKEMQEMIRRRRSSVMCGAGRMLQHNRQFEDSKQWYLMALKVNPYNYKAFLGLAASLLKIRIIYR